MRKSIATIKGASIAVIGGGIGGLTAAACLSARGAKVTVFEQAPALQEVGAGLQITPNGARVLAKIGLDPDGITAEAVVPMDGKSGRPLARFDLSQKSPPYKFVHRARLIDQLSEVCSGQDVALRLAERQTEIPKGFDLVVGADGLHSIVRPKLNETTKPFFTNQVAWRATLDATADPQAQIWMLPGAHVVTYPLQNGRLNVVAVQERAEWADEGWHHPDTAQNLQQAFSNACSALQDILKLIDAPMLWGLFRHPVAKNWHGKGAALLGDAAHPTLPFLAQGANLAIEDAYVLARSCDDHGIAQGLRRYAQLRIPRVTRAIAAANKNARNYHLSGLSRVASFAALQGIGVVAPDAFINRLGWLYDHDVTA